MPNREWAQRYIEAINGHDAKAITSFMTEDAVYEDITLGEHHQGTAAIADFWTRMASEFSSDYRMELQSFVSDGQGFAAEWLLIGTHDGVNPMLPPTGKPYRIPGVSIGTLRGDRIATNRDYWDMAGFLGQIGMMPAPEGASAG